jgi:hypothetical protein
MLRRGSSKKISHLVFLRSARRLLVTASVVTSSPILATLMKDALGFPKRRFLHEPHGVTPQKTPFVIATAVKASNLTVVTVISTHAHSEVQPTNNTLGL